MPNKEKPCVNALLSSFRCYLILLIDENDVTAGHAASIGQVDQKTCYLMSRGLDQATARTP